MNQIINFIITKDEEGYVASATNAFIVTQGDTFDELIFNIKDALSLHFEDDKLVKSPFFNLIYSDQVLHA
jgi:predicted RNase H-like HicB family nuclease